MTIGKPTAPARSSDYTSGINGSTPATGGTSSTSGPAPTQQVFLGLQNTVTDPLVGEGNLRPNQGDTRANVPHTVSLAEAQAQWYTWSQAERLAFAKKGYALGYLTSPLDLQGAQSLWSQAVGESANFFSAGKTTVTPQDVLDMYAGSNADTLEARAQAGPGGITTSKSVNLTDKLGVQALATQVLQQALGRDPTQAELNTYYNTIRSQEEANPNVTTQKPLGNGVTQTTSSGGFSNADAQQFLLSKIQNDPEYAKFQAGTTYFQAAMAANAAIGGA